ncbi:helix-turn-helix transcriptional regulator [Micromonospora sp. STR1_7]|uniref:Helix-turn-helix transcriptional regulator n=1 Tax=Micromonospora parastrephiae TaxID=2806101 RepID=A0ABS1Y1N7_9ACTN|nr:helix-turn-helix transcriptional regulator [Micromonospora parastrephiae]MBM0235433.1 helix-turn-helix transcriptional regulator [Micromonospora parastrephiae]
MPARIRTVVDPRFPAELARLRSERGLSLRDLARLGHFSKSYLCDLESARARPTCEVAAQLDTVLGAGGVLTALVVDAPAVTTPDDDQRLAHAIAHPTKLDVESVHLIADVLAAQRRLDDTLPAPMMLPWSVPQWRTVQGLAADARGPAAAELHAVAAEWTQFVGWLHAEARNDAAAIRVLGEATDEADALGSGLLAAQALNFRGYLERQRGNPRGIVRYFLAAYHTPDASLLQRVGDAVQAAHGYALLGDEAAAVRLLGEASDLTTAAESTAPPATAYWLSPTFSRMGLGLAYLALGDQAAAVDNLRAGLAGLPADQRDAEWTQEYRQALETAGG